MSDDETISRDAEDIQPQPKKSSQKAKPRHNRNKRECFCMQTFKKKFWFLEIFAVYFSLIENEIVLKENI